MLQVRDMCLGMGKPKICVPLTAATLVELCAEVKDARDSKADFVEWRADYFDTSFGVGIPQALKAIREDLGNMPLLFTYRTSAEGGGREIGKEEYQRVNRESMLSGCLDLIDIELTCGDGMCRDMIEAARQCKVITVLSSHDFNRTPTHGEMLSRMRKAVALGGDIPKIAVTPQSPADVITLLSVGEQFARENPDHLHITISMGKLGEISRVSGEFFASAFSFASLGRPTAPGQLSVADLHTILEILHKSES